MYTFSLSQITITLRMIYNFLVDFHVLNFVRGLNNPSYYIGSSFLTKCDIWYNVVGTQLTPNLYLSPRRIDTLIR